MHKLSSSAKPHTPTIHDILGNIRLPRQLVNNTIYLHQKKHIHLVSFRVPLNLLWLVAASALLGLDRRLEDYANAQANIVLHQNSPNHTR